MNRLNPRVLVGNAFFVVGCLGLISMLQVYWTAATRVIDVPTGPSIRAQATVMTTRPNVSPDEPAGATRDASIGLESDGRAAETTSTNAVASERNADAPASGVISHLTIQSIGLDTDVVVAPYVARNGGTWEIPAFKPGHAERSGRVGAPGNAIVFGHVASINNSLGDIFGKLKDARVGDSVQVSSGTSPFGYVVTDVHRVSRTDLWVLDSTDKPVLTLVTCTGFWVPFLNDFAERLIVHAELQ